MYTLPPTKDYYSLGSAVNHQTAFTCTHFHLQKTITLSEVQLIIRRPSHVHISTYKRLLLPQKCSQSSDNIHMYTFPPTNTLCHPNSLNRTASKCTHLQCKKILFEISNLFPLISSKNILYYHRLVPVVARSKA